MLAALAPAVTPAYAQISCEDPKIVDKLPKLPDGCQKERITASGNQRVGLRWANSSAENAWKDQTLTKFGERFITWANAACPKEECVPGALAGFKRCTYSGFPCAHKPVFGEGVYELSTSEIQEMQRLLTKYGYRQVTDGKFGEKTSEALQKWQRSKKITDDGLPTRENLDKLRKG